MHSLSRLLLPGLQSCRQVGSIDGVCKKAYTLLSWLGLLMIYFIQCVNGSRIFHVLI